MDQIACVQRCTHHDEQLQLREQPANVANELLIIPVRKCNRLQWLLIDKHSTPHPILSCIKLLDQAARIREQVFLLSTQAVETVDFLNQAVCGNQDSRLW